MGCGEGDGRTEDQFHWVRTLVNTFFLTVLLFAYCTLLCNKILQFGVHFVARTRFKWAIVHLKTLFSFQLPHGYSEFDELYILLVCCPLYQRVDILMRNYPRKAQKQDWITVCFWIKLCIFVSSLCCRAIYMDHQKAKPGNKFIQQRWPSLHLFFMFSTVF